MTRFTLAASTVVVVLAASTAFADDKPAGEAQALQARDVLKEFCYRCHKGKDSRGGRFNAAIYETLSKGLAKDEEAVLIPGKPDDSPLWQQIASGDMPYKKSPEAIKMTAAQKDVVKSWIAAGAPAWKETEQPKPPRSVIDLAHMLTYIRDDLRNAPIENRPYLRYYTLTHLHNQPRERIPDEDLDRYRAALCKAVNSLSWKIRVAIPRPIDPDKTILAIDLRDVDWDRNNLWKYVLACYPYGLTYDTHGEDAYRTPYVEIVALSGTRLPYVRADWFVSTATRAPLYNALLQIPDNVDALEARLGVNLIDNFNRSRLDRAGFGKSEVSPQSNRLVERHDATTGGYWRSYDFRAGADNSQLPQFPLGPVFEGNPFPDLAFKQAGGEIIFNLPNGLQGYMLVDGQGKRLDVAPDFVVDPQQTSGTAAIVNGLSCMACHDLGMKTGFKDEIREGSSVGGAALIKVRELFPPPAKMNEKLEEDRKRFLDAEQKTIAPFVAAVKDKGARGPEPISRINQYYRLDRIGPEVAAAELGLPSAERLSGAIQGNSRLRELGLGPLARGGNINRADWEKIEGNSTFQRAARELEMGTPYRELVSGFSCEPQK